MSKILTMTSRDLVQSKSCFIYLTLNRTLKFHSLKIKQLFQIITLVNMRLNAPETTVVCQITINTILNYNPIYEKVFRNTFDSTHCYAVSREICVTKTTFLGCKTYQNDLNRFMSPCILGRRQKR